MHTLGFKFLGAALCAAISLNAHAAISNVDVGAPLPRFALIHEGAHHYLRYMNRATPMPRSNLDPRGAFRKKRLAAAHAHQAALGRRQSTIDAHARFIVRRGTFRPRTHETIAERDGKRKVEGFAFAPDKITGMKELADNAQKDLSVDSPEPTFNFETDIEFLQALPLAAGYEANINFYHPGGRTPPQRYLFKVTGAASIAGPAGPVDCWVVTTDYNRPGSVSTFWFAKGRN